ncbi:hypothetical protein I316_01852 [Kwoniella heveanensis BCC8398]|uniref:Uncharacterized protein n=1 Tax=Kwoniella heveanensis BCC8398 TaxID=1296120 RepID=A0A1B9H010_9TREE|nr:hypothetical protein I316_01852 [Kwoniella heveanensis BCC8398]
MSDLENDDELGPVTATLHGRDVEGLVERVLAAGGDEVEGYKLKRARYTVEEAVEDSSTELRQELVRLSSILPNGPPMRARRIQMHLREFVKLHKPNLKNPEKQLGEGKLQGKERTKEGIVDRLKDYLTIRVLQSKKRDKKTFQFLVNPITGKPIYMTIHGLEHYLRLALYLHAEILIQTYGLTQRKRRKTTLYPSDVRALLEILYENSGSKWDVIVQNAALLLSFMYLGARPGSFLKTAHWPKHYARWKDIKWRPVRDGQGTIIGYDLYFTVRSFKGYHMLRDLNITFLIKTIKTAKNAILDLGVTLLAHGVRQGVFGEKTIEQLTTTNLFEFKCDPRYDEEPIFKGKRSRNGLSAVNPMRDEHANTLLRELMNKLGIACGQGGSDTVYSLRRGYATTVGKNLDARTAIFHMGQRANTTMFTDTYDQGHETADMTEGVHGQEERDSETRVVTPLTLTRYEPGTDLPTVTLKQALKVHPAYLHTKAKLDFVQHCIRTGSSEWQTVSPYKQEFKSGQMTFGDLVLIRAKYKFRLKQIVQSVKTGEYENLLAKKQAASDEQAYELIMKRREDANKPSDLAAKLQKRLIDDERALIKDQNAGFDSADLEEAVIVGGDWEDEEGDNDADDYDYEAEDEDEDQDDGQIEGSGTHDSEAPHGNQEQGGAAQPPSQDVEQGEDDVDTTLVEDPDAVTSSTDRVATNAERERMAQLEKACDKETNEDLLSASTSADPPLDSTTATSSSTLLSGHAFMSATEQKMTLLRTLCTLKDPNRGDQVCPLCVNDDTTDEGEKTRVWRAGQRFEKHKITFHSPYRYALRWINSHVSSGTFTCPFPVDPSSSAASSASSNLSEPHTVQTCGKTYLRNSSRDIKNHCLRYHEAHLSGTLKIGLDPTTVQDQLDQAKVQMKDLIGREYEIRANFTHDPRTYLVPGTLGELDLVTPEMALLGMGAGLHGTNDLSFETTALDMTNFDEDGLIKQRLV